MLKKNVYILYPAGYSGSYISWAINASDKDLARTTVANPVNKKQSAALGGPGTSHLHTRIPTHQNVDQHLVWVLYNRPTDCRVYIINADGHDVYRGIATIAQYDPDGVFISIHNNNDADVDSYGTINCVTKWPTYIDATLAYKWDMQMHNGFNAHDCATDRLFRNWVVDNHRSFFRHNLTLDNEKLGMWLKSYIDWYNIRHESQPHEVNKNTYIAAPSLDNRVFELSCKDIPSEQFLQWFDKFMEDSDVSDSWDTTPVASVHQDYITAQENLHWFESIQHWEETGQLDEYLTSHSVIEAMVIERIFTQSNNVALDDLHQARWAEFYSNCRGPDWPDNITSEYQFWDLPKWVQEEIINFGYQFSLPGKPNSAILELDWRNMSLDAINHVYQQTK